MSLIPLGHLIVQTLLLTLMLPPTTNLTVAAKTRLFFFRVFYDDPIM